MLVLMLGPVEVRADGESVPLGGPKPKALLAALTQHPRQVLSIEHLIDLIWDESPPNSATALVHTYVSALRRGLAAIGRQSALATRSPGYLFDVQRTENDLEIHDRHLDLARRLEREGDHPEAMKHYQQALALWRGPAFGGIEAAFVRARAAALEEDRLSIEEGLARCDLAAGRPDECASRMARVSATHPLREEARGLLMRGLYESGRQADALTAYRDGRRHLRDELGIEPGAKLRSLHDQVLSGALSPLVPAARTPAGKSVKATAGRAPAIVDEYTVPRNLPPGIGDFTGRAKQVEALRQFAASAREHPGPATPTVVVSGFGGAGKSALAVHAAYLLKDVYPDGQLFADLRGADGDAGVRDALGRFLGALGVTVAERPDNLDDRVELYRRKIAGRNLVIVLDNVSGEHQVRKLLPGSPGCLVIITSRMRLTGLEASELLELDFFTVDVSVEMLSKMIGPARIATDPASATTIARLCGGIPLAIRAAGGKLLARPHWPLRALADRLSDERRRLDELAVGDLAIRSSLQLNYAELTGGHRRAFHLLTLLDLPDFGSWLVAPLLDVSTQEAEDVTEHLVDLRLLDVAGVDPLGRVRYRFHDLVQLFGAEHAAEEEVDEAFGRMLTTWRSLVEAGARRLPRATLGLWRPSSTGADLDPGLRAEVEENPTGWLRSETSTVVRIVERTHELGVDKMATTLIASLLSSPFAVRNEFDGWQRTLDVALVAARTAGDRGAEATVLARLGQLSYEKDDFAAAREHFQQALRHAEAVGDEPVQAVARVGIGIVHRDLGHFGPAAAELSEGARIAERIGDQVVVAAALYGLGTTRRDAGDLDEAAEILRTSVALNRKLDDKRGEALSLRGLSLCHRAAGEPDPAAELSEQAVRILVEADDPLSAEYARQSLAKAMIRQGRTARAGELLDASHRLFDQHGDRFGVALVTRTQGELALAEGADARARDLLTTALDQWTELGLDLWRARTLRDLAAAEWETDPAAASRHWREAVEAFTLLGGREAAELAGTDPRGWRTHVRRAEPG
ncbi:DNA-binding transcriptional activator of the SARP family [Nonomuraea solani]|uniref:DNA-binding transcriptional activator of the SARP family n=1 Tax=Nonomuraea solani TaxID=1144553 RepID=A0A1H5WHZ2_9ACTN|nr:BTAD domain-containing putative transcriptional regulator [Nonomuraea solani]SEF98920.1 DNA-binding transcriptional activator of the SARP family [Nonomuraea solani]